MEKVAGGKGVFYWFAQRHYIDDQSSTYFWKIPKAHFLSKIIKYLKLTQEKLLLSIWN